MKCWNANVLGNILLLELISIAANHCSEFEALLHVWNDIFSRRKMQTSQQNFLTQWRNNRSD